MSWAKNTGRYKKELLIDGFEKQLLFVTIFIIRMTVLP